MIAWIGSSRQNIRSFLFLDRDGVVNVDQVDYVKKWEEFQFYSDALEALQWLAPRGVGVILASNQSALGRGIMAWEDFWEIHQKMTARVREAGGGLLGAFYCPHRPDEKCPCRKPAPGLLLRAAQIFAIPLETTYFIGNARTDMQAAERAGCRRVLLNRFGEGSLSAEVGGSGPPDACCSTLSEAVRMLFGGGKP
jgi:D-glycero-D-manno-heptose 1,7-bisphosphate phosphatase